MKKIQGMSIDKLEKAIARMKKNIKKVSPRKLYTSKDIEKLGLILNTQIEPSEFTLYRLIKLGRIKAVDLSTTGEPRYFVKGKDLVDYVKAKYNI